MTKTDTVVFRDTIFSSTVSKIDTTIGDYWYSIKLEMHYPSTIKLSPKMRSEKYITTFSKKETVNPPKKFWLFRLFQKKHKVL